MRWFLARLLYEHHNGFCILPQLRSSSGRFGSKRIQLINPAFYLFFAELGFCFCVYYSSGGNRHEPTGWGAVRPSHRIFFTNYAFKAEAVV